MLFPVIVTIYVIIATVLVMCPFVICGGYGERCSTMTSESMGQPALNYSLKPLTPCGTKRLPSGHVKLIPKLIRSSRRSDSCRRIPASQGFVICRIPDCSSSPCWNGWCEEAMESYRCHCPPQFSGEHCELPLNIDVAVVPATSVKEQFTTTSSTKASATPSTEAITNLVVRPATNATPVNNDWVVTSTTVKPSTIIIDAPILETQPSEISTPQKMEAESISTPPVTDAPNATTKSVTTFPLPEVSTPGIVTKTACSSGWSFFGSHCYKFSSNGALGNLSWHREQCAMEKAAVLEITSSEENIFIANTFLRAEEVDLAVSFALLGCTSENGHLGPWGCTASDAVWGENTRSGFWNWSEGEPNEPESISACLRVQPYSGGWYDQPCTEKHSSVCKKIAFA